MVHFVVEGSCLVDVARNMLLSDRPEIDPIVELSTSEVI